MRAQLPPALAVDGLEAVAEIECRGAGGPSAAPEQIATLQGEVQAGDTVLEALHGHTSGVGLEHRVSCLCREQVDQGRRV